ncbi:hypothetical protein [Desulfatitalea alkaliphila]|uniref:Uncharacterized protein n=1 Tax=Desulfatitalea alkaliphila TaxID=2929485 RepID=A0AA41UP34_9BACT|nr:hypothetical protein [Desulfatitalea alkaliphila]MCJ8500098.1 hypothetical protein [Desulfatitalea alkaliphila]
MRIKFTPHRFEGERVVQTSPEISNRISSQWYRRPLLFTGRALTADTLIANTKHHLRHLQLSGRHVSAGVIQGLTLSHHQRADVQGQGAAPAEQWLRLSAGLGITRWGEDITLPETADILLDNVAMWDSDLPPRGAGIFVLQPLEILDEIVSDEADQCPWDEARDPFDDEQIVDGCRLVFVPWPVGLLGPIPRVQNRQFRNQLVYQIFEYERTHPDTLFPWEQIGVPVGLAYITVGSGRIMFIDPQAVVRQGGAPLSTRPLLSMNGLPFLWEARMQQFIGQMADLRQQLETLPPAQANFDKLPPVGVLPKQAMNLDEMRSDFFPSPFFIEAAPIPEEQLEVAMNASAGLAPFDLYQPEKIKLLVPVPQAVYQPDLLQKETPDPIFLETLRQLIGEIRRWAANRDHLRGMAAWVMGAIDTGQVPTFEADPGPIDDEGTFPVAVPHDPKMTDHGIRAAQALSGLHAWIQKHAAGVSAATIRPLLPTVDPPQFAEDFKGLENFIVALQNNITRTEALLNAGFVRAETDMYRLRQILLGNVKASRLAVSPAMASIVGGQAAMPTTADVERYFASAITTTPTDAMGRAEDQAAELTPEGLAPGDLSGTTEDEKIDRALRIIKKRESGQAITTEELMSATRTLASVTAGRYGDARKTIAMLARPESITKFRDKEDLYYATAAAPAGVVYKFKEPVRVAQPGAAERDKPMVERVYESPAMEVKANTVKTKSTIFALLAEVPLDIDEKVGVTDSQTAIVPRKTYDAFVQSLTDPEKVLLGNRARLSDEYAAVRVTPLSESEKHYLTGQEPAIAVDRLAHYFANLAADNDKNRLSFKAAALGKNIQAGIFDPDPTDGDEANFFAAGVTALEQGLNAMRSIEQRLKDHKKALRQCDKVLIDLRAGARLWQDKLGEADQNLTVLRHDALVTRALFEEERTRCNTINQQRRAILDTYATSLVFVRPRLADPRLDVPAVALQPAYVNPVPTCLAEDFEAVGELAEMLDVFREMPIAWLTAARGLVRQIRTAADVTLLLTQAGARMAHALPSAPPPTAAYKTYTTHALGQAIGTIVAANQQVKQVAAEHKRALEPTRINTLSWFQLTDRAETLVSLADLIASGKGFTKAARQAIAIMENLEDVAVCLHHRVDGLAPAIKLQWAHRISIHDQAPDLRHLDVLPAFERIDITTRTDLQTMVDWLFSQVDVAIDQARRTMNDLVRVCLLLAGHAPVSTIVNGHVAAPASGKTGDSIEVTIGRGQVKVGMAVTITSQGAIALQGVVADVRADAARVKVTGTRDGGPVFSIDKGAQVHFVAAGFFR